MKGISLPVLLGVALLLGACETMSEYGGRMKQAVGVEDQSKKYVVYFKLNSTELTQDSEGILFDAMQAIQQDKVEKIRIVGFTDTTGNPRYNQQLSMRRAEAIRSRLGETGAKAIDVSDAGELVSSADAATARRAEIYLEK